MRWMNRCLAGLAAALGAVSAAHAFTITPIYDSPDNWTPDRQALVQQVITNWTSNLSFGDGNWQNMDIHFNMIDAGTGTGSFLSQWSPVKSQGVEFPYSEGITHTIYVNSAYLPIDSFALDGPVAGKYDMLTVLSHEMGHALGFAPGIYMDQSFIDPWNSHIVGNVFDPGGLNVAMAADHAHVGTAGDLMYFSLGAGTRVNISDNDLEMLSLAYGYSFTPVPVPEPAALGVLALGTGLLALRRGRIRSARRR